MTQEELIMEVNRQFGNLRRPDMFICGTCQCEECLEHEKDMQSFTREALPLDKLENPGWDPICFASDEAFAYLLPGLVRLVLEHTDNYVQQFLFHVDQPNRVQSLSKLQAQTLIQVLDFLLAHRIEALHNNLAVDDLNRAKQKLG